MAPSLAGPGSCGASLAVVPRFRAATRSMKRRPGVPGLSTRERVMLRPRKGWLIYDVANDATPSSTTDRRVEACNETTNFGSVFKIWGLAPFEKSQVVQQDLLHRA